MLVSLRLRPAVGTVFVLQPLEQPGCLRVFGSRRSTPRALFRWQRTDLWGFGFFGGLAFFGGFGVHAKKSDALLVEFVAGSIHQFQHDGCAG